MWKRFRLMAADAAPAGGGAAAAAAPAAGAAAPAAAAAAAAAPAAGAAAAAASAPTSALASAPAAGAAAAAPAGLEFLQEKFHVKDAAGKLDEAASLRKQAEAYAPLVKRLGTDEMPPATAAEYKLTMPAELDQAAFDEFVKDPATVAALEGMHKLGLTNKQVDAVMQMYLQSAATMAAGGQALSAEDTITDLRKDWKTEAELTKNIGAARHAATELGSRVGLDFAAIEAAGLANNPAFIRMMAALAPELGEDTAPAGAALPATDLDSLVKSKAYMDPNDPNHAAVKAKVAAHFAAQAGAGNKPKGPVSIQL
jgi:hypothetical protein